MKILILNTLYTPYKIGGAEKSVQSLAESFAKNNMEVIVLTLGTENKKVILNGVTIKKLRIQNIYWPFNNEVKNSAQKLLWHIRDVENKKYDKNITELLDSFKADILFTNNLSGFSVRVWKLAKNYNIKTVHTLRDYYLQCPKAIKYKNQQNCTNQCIDCKTLSFSKKTNSKNIDVVVGISNFILKDHISNGYFSNSKQRVIYNGFSFNRAKENDRPIKKKNITFGYIGQINQSKGIEFLLKTFNKLEETNQWRLIIAGKTDTSYLKKLKEINSSKKIKYSGYLDANDFFKSIDVLIVPSLWEEPFGRVVLEGLIHGKVVLGSKVGGIKELLINNKDFLFTPNTDELYFILQKLLAPSNFVKEFNFDDEFLDKFRLDSITNQYIKLFEEIIN